MFKMKSTLIFLVLILSIGASSCKRENNKYMSEGIITGADIRMCACCGGWYITVDTANYEFTSLPENSNIDLQTSTFPLKVKLDWQFADRSGCPNKFITILRVMTE
jgi:hypothetical protein